MQGVSLSGLASAIPEWTKVTKNTAFKNKFTIILPLFGFNFGRAIFDHRVEVNNVDYTIYVFL